MIQVLIVACSMAATTLISGANAADTPQREQLPKRDGSGLVAATAPSEVPATQARGQGQCQRARLRDGSCNNGGGGHGRRGGPRDGSGPRRDGSCQLY